YAPTTIGNENLLWEKQQQANIGVDAVFLNNRLEASIDVYQRVNKDFLYAPGQPGTFGSFGNVVGVPYRNIGQLSNKGVEMSFTWKDVIAREWKYDVSVNLTFNKNNIDELAPEFSVTDFFPPTPESRIGAPARDYTDHPMGTFYGLTQAGIFQDASEVNDGVVQDGEAVGRFK